MKFKGEFVILIVFVAFTVNANPTRAGGNCGRKQVSAPLVFGGEYSKRHARPWLVNFQRVIDNQVFCGGSLVSVKHILSAAHCFHEKNKLLKKPQEVVTLVGKHDLTVQNENGSAVHKVWEILVHPQWKFDDDPSYDADISLVVLETNVELTDKVAFVCIPKSSESKVTGRGFIVGWGANEWTEENGKWISPTPKELQVPVVTNDKCEENDVQFMLIISDRTFCAGYVGEDKSAGLGDSGGGMFQIDRSLQGYKLTGIVSTAPIDEVRQPRKDTYSVYTDVSKFVNWIEKQMRETEEIKWKYVYFDCERNMPQRLYIAYPEFRHNFTGPFTRNLRIRQTHAGAVDIEELKIDFTPSSHIFAGIGENFPKLKTLWITNQKIKFVERENFAGLMKLEELWLSENEIEFLPEDVFAHFTKLRWLGILGNKIKKLPAKIFEKLPNIETIWTYGNPATTNGIDFSGTRNVKLWNETGDYYYQGEGKFNMYGMPYGVWYLRR